MKICMIGLGSIGSRHLKNLHNILKVKGIKFRIDALRSSKEVLPDNVVCLLKTQYFSFEELPNDYDIIFITNPTSEHYASIKRCLRKTKHMFIEKPIFDHTNYDIAALSSISGICYVACPLRYSSVLQYIKTYIRDNEVFSGRCICSSYLPAWHPDADYRMMYSAHFEMGGGVRLDLIHELDYICHLFGLPEEIKSIYGKFSNLEISSEDIALYIARYNTKVISLHLDYFGRIARRELEIYTKKEVVVGDFIKQHVRFLTTGEVIDLSEDRNAMYLRELDSFFEMIENQRENENDINRAVNVLKFAMGDSCGI